MCINQNDDKEKGVQVNMMDQIYSNALCAIIWLGPEEADTHLAFNIIAAAEEMVRKCHAELTAAEHQRWGTASRVGSKHMLFSHLVKSQALQDKVLAMPIVGPLGSPLPAPFSPEAWTAVIKFLKRPWFTRTWIVQEFVLPTHIDIFCGSKALDSWTLLIFHVVFGSHFPTRDLADKWPQGSELIDAADRLSGVCAARHHYQETKILISLPDAVMVHREKGATDPRDKIFAHIGFSAKTSFKADYTKPAREIYHSFAVQNFGIMRDLMNKMPTLLRAIPDLPSWVPDWSAPRPRRSWIGCIFGAGGKKEKWQARLSSDKGGLILKGVLFDRIRDTRPISNSVLKPDSSAPLKQLISEDKIFSGTFKQIGRAHV